MKFPSSIASRTMLVLIAGMLGVIATTILVGVFLFSPSHSQSAHWLPLHIRSMVEVLSAVPAADREEALANKSQWRWSIERPRLHPARDWHVHWLVRHMRHDLHQLGVNRVYAGIEPDDSTRYRLVMQLPDQTWLSLSTSQQYDWPSRVYAFVVVIAVFAIGLLLLAKAVTRRITRPLRDFAAAADRFGTDLNAPPMPDSGPDELQQASFAFNEMQRRIRRSVQERMQMTAAISHDLRTPLTRLRLRVEDIENTEDRDKAVADIEEMQAMITASLEFSRLGAVAEEGVVADINELVGQLCQSYKETLQAVDFTGAQECGLWVRPRALRRALSNLIDNALRYGQRADVAVRDHTDAVLIEVADRGPGIPEPERERVFSPFYRMESSRNRATGGTGLGLTVAQAVVNDHGGGIRIEDRPGGGAVFIVRLPKPAASKQE